MMDEASRVIITSRSDHHHHPSIDQSIMLLKTAGWYDRCCI